MGDRIHSIRAGLRSGDGTLYSVAPLRRYDAVTLSQRPDVMALGVWVKLPFLDDLVIVRMPADLDGRQVADTLQRGQRVRFPDAWIKTYTDVPEGIKGFEPLEQYQLYAIQAECCDLSTYDVRTARAPRSRSLRWLAGKLAEHGEVRWGNLTLRLWGTGVTPERLAAAEAHLLPLYTLEEQAEPDFWTRPIDLDRELIGERKVS
ncbi:hypothetical protein JW921_05915 [Candidatus Fermentibacterales bacterium]|nr:hypothetical protein [Candidatus Fermentibacterales bacterium]